jgi:hypothetical protein
MNDDVDFYREGKPRKVGNHTKRRREKSFKRYLCNRGRVQRLWVGRVLEPSALAFV